jgi:energy-coupling factor transporter ATP-binding protein EcfA2
MIPLRHPTTVLVAGPTGCGKTEFVYKLLTTREAIQPTPQRIIFIYSEWQPAYDRMKQALKNTIEFVKDYEPKPLYESISPTTRNMLVLDDQMDSENMKGNTLCKFFTQGSHHRNLTVLYIVQNLFNQDKSMRTVSLNSHYLVLFKNPRDMTQIRSLAQQMYPKQAWFLVDAFDDATSKPFSYILLDLRSDTPDEIRVRARMFDTDPTVYVRRV